ncbi:undecaprenyl-diphosphate phosphatase [Clostridia bacterium OttesenSCG-928-O13]|nr:undecaprenyl-diphosphate phosphatase [Clostridia bacterium OttesenSCG-928-O13]
MGILDGVLMGFIQGATEFLPVSSSGHLSLYQYFTGNSGAGSLFFTMMLHLGTLAAVIAAYYEDLWAMVKEVGLIFKEIFSGQFTFKAQTPTRKLLYMLFWACVPMLLVLPIHSLVSRVSGDNDIIIEGVCFLITSGLLFAACKAPRGKAGPMKMKAPHALVIGVMQGVAVFPGISRSGSTISTGMVLGFDREFMVKFSFLLGIPAILGGVVVEIGDVAAEKVEVSLWPLFLGMLTAAVVGYACIRLIRWLVLGNKFIIFAWYTLALGAVVVVLGIVGHIAGWGKNPAEPASAVAGLWNAARHLL